MKIRAVLLASIVMALLVSTPGFAQTGPDDLWEVTASIIMEGMRLPGQPTQVCVRKGQGDDRLVPMDENCQIADQKTVGNRTTFRIVCTGKDQITGTGEMTTGQDTYSGVLKLSGIVEGERMSMTTEFSGKRIGNCTAQ
jgi:hypothetical protein